MFFYFHKMASQIKGFSVSNYKRNQSCTSHADTHDVVYDTYKTSFVSLDALDSQTLYYFDTHDATHTRTNDDANDNNYDAMIYYIAGKLMRYPYKQHQLNEWLYHEKQIVRLVFDYDFKDEDKERITEDQAIELIDKLKDVFECQFKLIIGYGSFDPDRINEQADADTLVLYEQKDITRTHKCLSLHVHVDCPYYWCDLQRLKAMKFRRYQADDIINRFDHSIYSKSRPIRIMFSGKGTYDNMDMYKALKLPIFTNDDGKRVANGEIMKMSFVQIPIPADDNAMQLMIEHSQSQFEEWFESLYIKRGIKELFDLSDITDGPLYAQEREHVYKDNDPLLFYTLDEFKKNFPGHWCFSDWTTHVEAFVFLAHSVGLKTQQDLNEAYDYIHDQYTAKTHTTTSRDAQEDTLNTLYAIYKSRYNAMKDDEPFDIAEQLEDAQATDAEDATEEITEEVADATDADDNASTTTEASAASEEQQAIQKIVETKDPFKQPFKSFKKKNEIKILIELANNNNLSLNINANDYPTYTIVDFINDKTNTCVYNLIENMMKCCMIIDGSIRFRVYTKVLIKDDKDPKKQEYVMGYRYQLLNTTYTKDKTRIAACPSLHCFKLIEERVTLLRRYDAYTVDVHNTERCIYVPDEMIFTHTDEMDIQPFIDHIKLACGNDEDIYRLFMTTVAFSVHDPKKVQMVPSIFVFGGVPGAGKSIICKAISRVSSRCARLNMSKYVEKYNGQLVGRTIVMSDEVTGQKRETTDKLKEYTGSDVITIEEKYQPSCSCERLMHFIVTSNDYYVSPLWKDPDGDRRIIQTYVKKMSPAYYEKLGDLLDNPAFGYNFWLWLKHYTEQCDPNYLRRIITTAEGIALRLNMQPKQNDSLSSIPRSIRYIIALKKWFKAGITVKAMKMLLEIYESETGDKDDKGKASEKKKIIDAVLNQLSVRIQHYGGVINKQANRSAINVTIGDDGNDKVNGTPYRSRESYYKFDIDCIPEFEEYKDYTGYTFCEEGEDDVNKLLTKVMCYNDNTKKSGEMIMYTYTGY